MKQKIVKIVIAVFLLVTVMMVGDTIYANENQEHKLTNEKVNKPSFTSRDTKGYDTYKNHYKKEGKSKALRTSTIVNPFSEFRDFFTTVENVDTIYSNLYSNTLESRVFYSKDSNSYLYVEFDSLNNTILFILNDKKYSMIEYDRNISVYDELGNVLPIVINEYIGLKPSDTTIETNLNESSNSIQPMSASTYTAYRGPFYSTNKVVIEIVSGIATIGAVTSVAIKHPVLGVVSSIVGAISWAGGYAYATLYIKFWTSNKTTCLTAIREKREYYQYNNYSSGYLGTKVLYYNNYMTEIPMCN